MAMSSSAHPLRVGVLGTGRIGRLHAKLLAHEANGAQLGAVYDTDPASAAAVAQSLGVPAVENLEELVGSDDIDALAICTPTHQHVEHVMAVARAGKAIFCEKPIALDLESLDQALAVVAAAGVPLQVGFNRRFDPGHAAVAAAVARGDVGEPHLARISSRDPEPPPPAYAVNSGGIFLDMTIHDFDMARHVVGSEVSEVLAVGSVRLDPPLMQLGDFDTAVVLLRHTNGCLTSIDNSRRSVYGFDQRVEVFGSLGMASSANQPVHSATIHNATGMHAATLAYSFLERYLSSYLAQWREFVCALSEGRDPAVGPADARAALLIALAAARSQAERRPVSVREVA
jgi:myo-inositol 2-dehydrogenase/D-chiro-inositol 1-dehydrogenase